MTKTSLPACGQRVDADQIVVLDEGRLMDVGTHDELMSRSAIYREVYESQMKGGDEE